MILGLVPEQVGCLDHALRLVVIGKVDEACALGAEHIEA